VPFALFPPEFPAVQVLCELRVVPEDAEACQESPQELRETVAGDVAAGCSRTVHEVFDAEQSRGRQADEYFVAVVDVAVEALVGEATAVVLQIWAELLQAGPAVAIQAVRDAVLPDCLQAQKSFARVQDSM
jgi:hypothetical protein